MALGDAILHQPHVTARVRELAILAVCATHTIPFVSYAHSRVAASLGLSSEQVNTALKGEENEEATYKLALELGKSRDVLDQNTWEESVKVLDKEGVARVAQVVGCYLYSGALLRVGAVEAPVEA